MRNIFSTNQAIILHIVKHSTQLTKKYHKYDIQLLQLYYEIFKAKHHDELNVFCKPEKRAKIIF